VLRIKHFIEQSWLLIVASFCFGLLIAGTNYALSARIERNRTAKLYSRTGDLLNAYNAATDSGLPKAELFDEFAEIEIASLHGKSQPVKVIRARSADEQTIIGWSFNASGSGFQDKIELAVAVDRDFEKIAGYDVLLSNETPGYGDQIKLSYLRDQFIGAPAGELKPVSVGEPRSIDAEIVTISGATISSEAVVEIISNSVTQIKEQMQEKGLISNDE
jgi:electron transport complex protein RnfG